MIARRHTHRAAMTLVELLVVVAIIGLLAVAVLPSLANTTEARRTKETARLITSFISKSQAEALGKQTPSGFALLKAGASTIDLAPAKVPEPYRGDTPTASVACTYIPGPPPTMSLTFTGAFASGAWLQCEDGDLIRFDNIGPWYLLTRAAGGISCTMRSGTTSVDSLAGQTDLNTPWPEPAPTRHTFEILRKPAVTGPPLSLGGGRCIDTHWSSASQPGVAYFGASNSPIAPTDTIYVLFDAAGRVHQIVAGDNRFASDGPIFLLVGRVDRAGRDPVVPMPAADSDDSVGANWQYPDSIWIALDPVSGVCRTAACDTSSAAQTPPSGVDATAWRVRQSQNFVLAELQLESR